MRQRKKVKYFEGDEDALIDDDDYVEGSSSSKRRQTSHKAAAAATPARPTAFDFRQFEDMLSILRPAFTAKGTSAKDFAETSIFERSNTAVSVFPSKLRDAKELQAVSRADPLDVVFGRGNTIARRPGNWFFRQVIGINKAYYRTCGEQTKAIIARFLVFRFEMCLGARFLEMDSPACSDPEVCTVFREVDYARVVEKCMQTLREKKNKTYDFLALMRLMPHSPVYREQRLKRMSYQEEEAQSATKRLPSSRKKKAAASSKIARKVSDEMVTKKKPKGTLKNPTPKNTTALKSASFAAAAGNFIMDDSEARAGEDAEETPDHITSFTPEDETNGAVANHTEYTPKAKPTSVSPLSRQASDTKKTKKRFALLDGPKTSLFKNESKTPPKKKLKSIKLHEAEGLDRMIPTFEKNGTSLEEFLEDIRTDTCIAFGIQEGPPKMEKMNFRRRAFHIAPQLYDVIYGHYGSVNPGNRLLREVVLRNRRLYRDHVTDEDIGLEAARVIVFHFNSLGCCFMQLDGANHREMYRDTVMVIIQQALLEFAELSRQSEETPDWDSIFAAKAKEELPSFRSNDYSQVLNVDSLVNRNVAKVKNKSKKKQSTSKVRAPQPLKAKTPRKDNHVPTVASPKTKTPRKDNQGPILATQPSPTFPTSVQQMAPSAIYIDYVPQPRSAQTDWAEYLAFGESYKQCRMYAQELIQKYADVELERFPTDHEAEHLAHLLRPSKLRRTQRGGNKVTPLPIFSG